MSVQTMESMVRWVDDNIFEEPSLEKMSAHVGYSPYYCSSKFREYTGITYKRYLAKCKLVVAEQLLIISNESITAIAHRCGFSSLESFSRAFINANNCTPSQYRKKCDPILQECMYEKQPCAK